MPKLEERVAELEGRIQTMDGDLKQHFTEFRTFVVEALDGVERRLGATLGAKIDGLASRVEGVETKLDLVLSRLPQRPRPRRRRRR